MWPSCRPPRCGLDESRTRLASHAIYSCHRRWRYARALRAPRVVKRAADPLRSLCRLHTVSVGFDVVPNLFPSTQLHPDLTRPPPTAPSPTAAPCARTCRISRTRDTLYFGLIVLRTIRQPLPPPFIPLYPLARDVRVSVVHVPNAPATGVPSCARWLVLLLQHKRYGTYGAEGYEVCEVSTYDPPRGMDVYRDRVVVISDAGAGVHGTAGDGRWLVPALAPPEGTHIIGIVCIEGETRRTECLGSQAPFDPVSSWAARVLAAPARPARPAEAVLIPARRSLDGGTI
ncbi:hypothetical protein C8R45DRAFT_1102084 [Mycena sanguinolenta]|nr:hypothetical protein C8R45DRAFT_1102084 [Mycena sanguinolenta]